MQELREDIFASGGCPVLDRLLPGVQREGACTDSHQKVSGLWKNVFVLFCRQALAKLLPGLPGKTGRAYQKTNDVMTVSYYPFE